MNWAFIFIPIPSQKARSDLFDDPYKLENYIQLDAPYVSNSGNQYYTFSEYLLTPRMELGQVIDTDEEWVLISDTLHADKAYEFMAFSRFNLWEDITFGPEDTTCGFQTVYSGFHIDDVSVHLIDEPHIAADAGADHTICLGDSAQLGSTDYEDYMYFWSPNEDMPLNIYGYTNPGMPWVQPTETTTYTLRQKDFAFEQTTDQVTVTVEYCPDFTTPEHLAQQIRIFRNPAQNLVAIKSPVAISAWQLRDALGKTIARNADVLSATSIPIDLSLVNAGLYFIEIEIEGQFLVKQLLVE